MEKSPAEIYGEDYATMKSCVIAFNRKDLERWKADGMAEYERIMADPYHETGCNCGCAERWAEGRLPAVTKTGVDD